MLKYHRGQGRESCMSCEPLTLRMITKLQHCFVIFSIHLKYKVAYESHKKRTVVAQLFLVGRGRKIGHYYCTGRPTI